MANPTLLISPIAENGDKNVIPATTGATTGLLDQEHGFQQINELPLQAGGLPPQRKDFNGAFNLLSKILFYAQKGYVFEYDENQDYYAGCITKDTDGGLYCANTDVPASSTHPKDDPTNWALINFGFNKKETFTSSGSFTAPVTGTYRITLQGGGGGGCGGYTYDSLRHGGGGGGQGGHWEFYEHLVAGTSYSFIIGAGGTGSTGSTGGTSLGTAGGKSSITVNDNIYECYGGNGGVNQNYIGRGGSGGGVLVNNVLVSRGISGQYGLPLVGTGYVGGGIGGGFGGSAPDAVPALAGGGGYGGGNTSAGNTPGDGQDGGDGFISFEYCDI